MDFVWVLIAALVATVVSLIKASGKREGVSQERKKSAVKAEEFEGELADAKLEAQRNKPLAGRIGDALARIRAGRGRAGDPGSNS